MPLQLLRAFLLQTLTLKFDINNLFRLRTRILCVLEYAAFFGANELFRINSSDKKFYDHYVFDVRSSKQDIYRRGYSVQKVITKSKALFRPVQC